MEWKKIPIILLILLGLLQSFGYVIDSDVIRNVGIVSVASPLPLVFHQVKGVETFASDFTLMYQDVDGNNVSRKITPEYYSTWEGPYNWRNVYGAAISYGPILDQKLWEEILTHGFCEDQNIRSTLENPGDYFEILIESRTANRNDQWRLEVKCE